MDKSFIYFIVDNITFQSLKNVPSSIFYRNSLTKFYVPVEFYHVDIPVENLKFIDWEKKEVTICNR
jgi:hypothetical protein